MSVVLAVAAVVLALGAIGGALAVVWGAGRRAAATSAVMGAVAVACLILARLV